jgi:Holliday junction DNA helicase RuvA
MLRGALLASDYETATVDVGGVGYEVHLPLRDLAALPNAGAEVQWHIYTHVREDALLLYGFTNATDRELFRLLLSVSGIGPKLAISILGAMSGQELARALIEQRVDKLQKIPGIGKKTAERMLLDLSDKVTKLKLPTAAAGQAPPAPPSVPERTVFSDLESALLNLGYRQAQIARVLERQQTELPDGTFEVLLRDALKRLI